MMGIFSNNVSISKSTRDSQMETPCLWDKPQDVKRCELHLWVNISTVFVTDHKDAQGIEGGNATPYIIIIKPLYY